MMMILLLLLKVFSTTTTIIIRDIELVSFKLFLSTWKENKSHGTVGTLFLGPVGIAEVTAAFAICAEVSLGTGTSLIREAGGQAA